MKAFLVSLFMLLSFNAYAQEENNLENLDIIPVICFPEDVITDVAKTQGWAIIFEGPSTDPKLFVRIYADENEHWDIWQFSTDKIACNIQTGSDYEVFPFIKPTPPPEEKKS